MVKIWYENKKCKFLMLFATYLLKLFYQVKRWKYEH